MYLAVVLLAGVAMACAQTSAGPAVSLHQHRSDLEVAALVASTASRSATGGTDLTDTVSLRVDGALPRKSDATRKINTSIHHVRVAGRVGPDRADSSSSPPRASLTNNGSAKLLPAPSRRLSSKSTRADDARTDYSPLNNSETNRVGSDVSANEFLNRISAPTGFRHRAADNEVVKPTFLRDQRRTDANIQVDAVRPPPLRFPVVPGGEAYRTPDLRLSEGLFLFGYLAQLLSWMQPFEFPVELLRDALWNRLTVTSLITQSLKVEAGFLVCLSVGLLLSLTAPGMVVVHACCRLCRGRPASAGPPPPPPQGGAWEHEYPNGASEGCRRGTLVCLMHLVLVLLVAGIVAMFVTNEQLSGAVQRAPGVLHAALADATTFLRNSHLQLHFVVTQSLDQAVDACVQDIDNIDDLLGRPIQRELASETGVDVALDVLVDVSKTARELADKVEALQAYTRETRDLASATRDRLAELRQQVDVFRRQCPGKDRPLCETVDAAGLDVVLRLDAILNDESLGQIRNLAGDNLTVVTSQARGEFQFIPLHVEKETKEIRDALRTQLSAQRTRVDDAVWALDVVTRALSAKVEDARDRSLQLATAAASVEHWRWLAALGATSAILLIWVLLTFGVSFGCCGVERRANGFLVASLVVVCLLTTSLWLLTLALLAVGGHGEVFVCRPLYDEPDFAALTRLLDNPGVLYRRGGFFSNLLYKNSTLDVSVREVLQKCRDGQPSYPAFRLSRVFDVESASDHRRWGSLHADLARLEVNLTGLQLLKPELQEQLQDLLLASKVNLTSFRTQLAGKVTGKDLSSFADQLEKVANQITDMATASRGETLASRSRRLFDSHAKVLEERKENMVYQLASIEVHLAPLQRQVNQSLSHFKTIQYYVTNQGEQIARRKTAEFSARLVGYLDQFRSHLVDQAQNHVATCRPLWNVFHALRLLLCRHVMDPLNGFWFASLWCLLLFLAATPLALKLMDHYREQAKVGGRLVSSGSLESQTETLVVADQGGGAWRTPGTQEPDGW